MFWTIALIISIYAAALLILIFISMFLVHRWTANKIIKKAKQKAAEPIDGTDWIMYSSNGSVKEQGKETRRITYGRRKENGIQNNSDM